MNIGFVGLGVMGSRIARRLLDAGYRLTGYNRTRSKAQPLIAAGMEWRDTPRAAAEHSDVVFSIVADTDALKAVTDGAAGIIAGLRPGAVYIEMSTVSPVFSRQLAERVRAAGATMLDAPVSGSPVTIDEGRLSFMVGGDPQALEQVRPILLSVGPTVTHVGANGQAALMKLATNLSVAVQFLIFCEGLVLAEKGGIPRGVALQVLLNSAIASPMLKYRGPLVTTPHPEVWFTVDMMQKDLRLGLEMARELRVALPTTATANELLTATRALGFGDKELAAVFHTLARMSGLEGA